MHCISHIKPGPVFLWLCLVMMVSMCFLTPDSFGQQPGTREKAPIELSVKDYVPDWLDSPYTILINEYVEQNPNVYVRPFTQLRLPAQAAGMSQGMLYLAFAGGIGPDVFNVWFHQLESWVNQGFIMDLGEFIGTDQNGDGYIDDDEAKIQEWKDMPPALRRAATIDGKPYGLPSGQAVTCIIYRRDIVREITGSEAPPRTWDEFFRICQMASRNPTKSRDGTILSSRRGFFADPNTYRWLPWLWSASGKEVVQVRTSQDGTKYEFGKEIVLPKSPTGENLAIAPLEWKATFASPEGIKAMGFYWKLFWQKWIRNPKNQEPVNLTDEEAEAGRVSLPDGSVIAFTPDEVFEGVSRGLIGDGNAMVANMFLKGEIVFYIGFAEEVAELIHTLSPSQVGLMAIPSPDGKMVTANIQPNYWWCLNSTLAKASKPKQKAAFKLISSITGDNLMRTQLQIQKQKENLTFADPDLLTKFGMEADIRDISPHWKASLKEIKQNAQTEPYIGKWEPVSTQLIGQEIISRIIADRDFDYESAMIQAQKTANNKVLRDRNEQEMKQIRPYAYSIFGLFVILFLWMFKKMWDGMKDAYFRKGANTGFDTRVQEVGIITRILPWFFLVPAIALVLMWTYYPLAQGTLMAFQDYKILADKPFIGLDNFITVMSDPKFYKYLWITVKFVVVNLVLGFITPIALAIMLNEIPHFKVTLRMIYLLPGISSGIVITFIWLMMYYPTEEGYFNAVLMQMGILDKPLQFLNDPNMALVWVTAPAVWAAIGGGSLIYLAALKNVPDDLYEAAEIDGAGFWDKLFKITVPTLIPLILINFIGTFIGLFKTMGNIFLMTGGGPGDETTVLSFAIWRDSFIFLKFGAATATAWVLAALLISFTVLQMRILSRVEFQRAEE